MKLLQRLQRLLKRQWAMALLLVLAGVLWILPMWLKKPQSHIAHSLGSSTQHADVLWIKQEIFAQIASNNNGAIYVMPNTRDSLKAINVSNGATIWKIKLPLERGGGARGLLADQNTVFVTTSIFVDAYEITTGNLRWSTKLGDGHVSVIPQLDSNVLRVYYGNKLIELDSETGQILTTIPKDAIAWVYSDIIFQTSPASQLTALDKQSGELLWMNDRLFYVDESQEPIDIGNGKLLVGFVRGICALDSRTGKYSWCRSEIEISNMAIDYESYLGFAMRADLVLLTIDLQTGNVLGETSFLSGKPIEEQIGSLSSITASNGVVVISFSDSKQTFGLRFTDYP